MNTPEPTNGDSSRVTTFQLYQKMIDSDKAAEARYAELRSEVRALQLTISGKNGITEVQTDHESRLRLVEKWKAALPTSALLFMATTAIALVGLFIRVL